MRSRILALAAGLAIATLATITAPANAAPGAFYAEVINRSSGKCVNLAGQSGDNGAWIQQYHCDNTPAAKFLFLQNRDGFYEISNQSSRKCIDIEYGGNWNGARTQQFNCNGSETQQWRINELNNGYVTLVNRHSGNKCLDVPWRSSDDRVILQIWECFPGETEQEFRLNIS